MAKNNDSIDLFKLLASIMIFVMHCSVLPFGWELMSRWAVPFFFITSSFFLHSNKYVFPNFPYSNFLSFFIATAGMIVLTYIILALQRKNVKVAAYLT